MKKKNRTIPEQSTAAGSASFEFLTRALKRWRQKLGYLSIMAATPAIAGGAAGAADVTDTPSTITGHAISQSGTKRKFPQRGKFFARRESHLLPHQSGQLDLATLFNGGDNCSGTPIPTGLYTGNAPFTDSGDTSAANNAVYRDGVWYINEGQPRFSTRQFGHAGDRPLAAPNTQGRGSKVAAGCLR